MPRINIFSLTYEISVPIYRRERSAMQICIGHSTSISFFAHFARTCLAFRGFPCSRGRRRRRKRGRTWYFYHGEFINELVVLRETQGYFVSIYHKQALTSRFMQISLFVEQVARRGNVALVKRDAISFRSFLNIIVWLYCRKRDRRIVTYVFRMEIRKNLFDTWYGDLIFYGEIRLILFDLNESLSRVNFFVWKVNFFKDVKLISFSILSNFIWWLDNRI